MRRCINHARCKRHAAGSSAFCGPCYWADYDATLGRRLRALQPGGRVELGGGWAIVRRSGDTGPGYMPRQTARMDFGGDA